MSELKQESMKYIFWFGLVFMLAGASIVWITFSGGMADEDTPLWIGVAAGGIFFSAGLMSAMMDEFFDPVREQVWFAYLQGVALLAIPVLFLLIFNWISFGPGEREFSASVSIPFLSLNFDRANQILGRIVFGIPALLGDAVVVYVLFSLARDWVNEGEEE